MNILHFSFCIFHFAFLAFGASTAAADAPPAVPIDGQPFPAELISVDADWQLTFRTDGKDRVLSAADLIRWGCCPAGQGRAGGLALADGSLLAGKIVAADDQYITIESEVFGPARIQRDAIAAIFFHNLSPRPLGEGQGVRAGDSGQWSVDSGQWAGDSGQWTVGSGPWSVGSGQQDAAAERPLPSNPQSPIPNSSSDRLLLDNGDSLSGRLLSIADRTVRWTGDIGPIDVKTSRVKAILLNPKPPAKTQSLRVWAGFRDGSLLLATQLILRDDRLKVTVAGQSLASPRTSLVFLQPIGGRAVYLSDLKPAEYHHTPFLNLSWPYQSDRNAAGGPLCCNGRRYLKGLGVHSAARLVYTISPLPLGEGQGVRAVSSPTRFQADLAIDDSAAGGGSVQFRVLVDGREKFKSPTIRGGDPPMPISVDITGAKQLELIVDYADRADVLDRADWLDARLTQ